MPRLTGPDFIGIQTKDLQAARAFYGDRLGLPVLQQTPDAGGFRQQTCSVRGQKAADGSGSGTRKLCWGVALWFGCNDADAPHKELEAAGIAIAFPPKDGSFGRYFAFRDPFGYTITVHTV